MGYQALLFCPDEKTARAVTQVLSELDFIIIGSTEPFAAVKKLMSERFDAVVVDCENEQNASLLFKSAHNAANNRSSLAVAVVEGQAGVAKAFRLGANLVLTKPINIEQAKGTLRVARGLLRKGEAARAATAAPTAKPVASNPEPPVPLPPISVRPPNAIPSFAASRSGLPVTPPAAVSPLAQDEALQLRGMGSFASGARVEGKPPASASGEQAPPWGTKSALQNSAPPILSPSIERAAIETEISKRSSGDFLAALSNFDFASTQSGTGAVSAAARAREAKSNLPLEDKPPVGTTPPKSKFAEFAPPATSSLEADETSTLAARFEPDAPAGNIKQAKSQTGLIAVGVLVIVAGAYLSSQGVGRIALPGWVGTQLGSMRAAISQAATAVGLHSSSSAAPAAQPGKPGAAATPQPMKGTNTPAPVTPSPSSKISGEDSPTVAESEPATNQAVTERAAPRPTVSKPSARRPSAGRPSPIKNEMKHHKDGKSAATTDAPAPSLADIASATESNSLPHLTSGGAAPKPVLAPLSVPQGESQGLLLKRLQPTYPANASRLEIEGAVQLLATISKKGTVSAVEVLSGDPQLTKAAADAVKQWKYKPYLVDGVPVEIQTQVTVNFRLPR